jgi:hypothetical protein
MFTARKTLVSTVIGATVALMALTAGSAQADPGKGDEPARPSRPPAAAPDKGASSSVTSSEAEAALALVQRQIAQYVATNGTKYTFGSYVDPATSQIVLDTDAPADVVATVTNLAGSSSLQRRAANRVRVQRVTVKDTWDRRDDIPSYYGGGGLLSGTSLCSSGYAVQRADGTQVMTTAGHCYANGASVTTESGNNSYGTVSDRRLPTVTGHAMDMELIGGSSYYGRIFTGGVNSTTSLPVIGAGSAVIGYTDYCHSGRTTGENCGHTATSLTAQVCTATGCKSPVIAFTGGTLPAGGDSGSPFYAKDSTSVWIRGHVIAGDGSTAYAEPWTVVASELGVSIVTS